MTTATTSRGVVRATRSSAVAVTVAATGAAGVCLGFAGLQVALAAGAPFGDHVWGGTQERVLPGSMRVVAGGAAVVLTGMAAVVARRAGLIGPPAARLGPATWAIAGYLALNTVGNVASTSLVERFAFGSATAFAATCAAYVAHRTRRC
jgi:hypothetical protein